MDARDELAGSSSQVTKGERGALGPRALVALGVEGSEASMVARCLSSLGIELPRTPLPPGGRPEAHFAESKPLVRLNEEVLEAVGSSWDDVLPFPASWYDSPDAREHSVRLAREIESEYAGSTLLVVKDPRIWRLLRLWIEVLDDLSLNPAFVFSIRSPLEVARSLERHHRIPAGKGLLIWLRSILDAERETRKRPRAFVGYEDMLRDWRGSARAIAETLGLTWPIPEHEAEVRLDDFRSMPADDRAPSDEEPKGQDGPLDWAQEAYDVLLKACRSGGDPDADSLDALGAVLAEADRVYRPVLADWRLGVGAIEGRLDFVSKERDARERELRRAKDDLDAREREIAALKDLMVSIKGSVSWRLTKPLRGAKALLKKAFGRE